jgi:hypothetical protein
MMQKKWTNTLSEKIRVVVLSFLRCPRLFMQRVDVDSMPFVSFKKRHNTLLFKVDNILQRIMQSPSKKKNQKLSRQLFRHSRSSKG